MTTGKLAWQMSPNVRRTLHFVRKLQDIAFAYEYSSDPKLREAALKDWAATMDQLDPAPVQPPSVRTFKSRRAAA